MENKQRPSGFYWVVYTKQAQVALYSGGYWFLPGTQSTTPENLLEYIDSRRLDEPPGVSRLVRKVGYYYVKNYSTQDHWDIAFWDGLSWVFCGIPTHFNDSALHQIGDRVEMP